MIKRIVVLAGLLGASAAPAGGDAGYVHTWEAKPGQAKPVEMKGDVTIAHGEVTGTYRCNGHALSIIAGRCQIILEGDCKAVSITGGENKVRANGKLGSVVVSGANNTVTWAPGKNPQAPSVTQVGANNRIEAAP